MVKEAKKQIFPSVRVSLIEEIEIMADRERRSFSEMVTILLENAVKERKRKRKNGDG